jgi:Tol biopolymer transport system component
MKHTWRGRTLSLILLLALLLPSTGSPTLAAQLEIAEAGVPQVALPEYQRVALISSSVEASTTEWTWQNPSPQGHGLNAVWGSASNDVYAVGDYGTIVHYDGTQWQLMDSGTTRGLGGVWGSSPTSVFAVGAGGVILHYDGTAWRAMNSGTSTDLNDVWGSGADNVFAVGSSGTIRQYDGSSWREMTSNTTEALNSVWGSAANNVFAVGNNGTIRRYDGTIWISMSSGTTDPLMGVWGSSGDDVHVTGYFHLLRYDGNTWSVTNGVVQAQSIWGTAPGDIYIVGYDPLHRDYHGLVVHHDGNVLSRVTTSSGAGLHGVWGSGSNDIFAVGQWGAILHYDGSVWHQMSSSITPLPSSSLDGIWGRALDEIFAVGRAGLYTYRGIYRYDGTAWSGTITSLPHALSDVWGSDGEVFAVGSDGDFTYYEGVIVHSMGGEWRGMDIGTLQSISLEGVWGSSPNDVYAVGDSGTILHYDGVVWRTMDSGTSSRLGGLWGVGPSDVYAVGDSGTILHYDGVMWRKMDSGTGGGLSAVWGTGLSDVFSVGDSGTILHYDGTAWQTMNSGTSNGLSGVWGSGPNDVFAVGYAGTILHYDGTAWRTMNSGTDNELRGVWGSGPNDVYVVGQGGTILHYGGPVGAAGHRAAGVPSPVQWIERVSVAGDGTQANGSSSDPSISRDGRYIAFSSLASNLVADDTNEQEDVFVHDLITRETTRVSVSSEQAQADRGASEPHISADGRYVAFVAHARNLVPDDNNGVADILVHDRATGETTRVSVSSTGEEGNGKSYAPYISGDGRYVVFVSTASNLVPNDTNSCEPAFSHADGHCPDIFVHDRETGETELVSVNSSGSQVNGESGYYSRPAISDDGHFVAFNRWDVDSPSAFVLDRVWIRDREERTTTTVSVVEYGDRQHSWQPSISADGLRVVYRSMTEATISGEASRCRAITGVPCTHIYVHDRVSGETLRASVDSQGRQGLDGSSETPRNSADGNLVVFSSTASNLVPDDTNDYCGIAGQQTNKSCSDIFVHDLSTLTTMRVSVRPDGVEANHSSRAPDISAHGEYVVFVSTADNLVDDDTNGEADVFVVSLVPSDAPPAPAATLVTPVAELVETVAPETSVPPATVEVPQTEEVDDADEPDRVELPRHAALPIGIALIIAGLLTLGVVAVFFVTRYRSA